MNIIIVIVRVIVISMYIYDGGLFLVVLRSGLPVLFVVVCLSGPVRSGASTIKNVSKT